jgi:hypothetical protein
MTRFFPHHTVEWKIEEPPALRRFSLSLVEMAVATGVLLRLYRAVALTNGAADSLAWLAVSFVLAGVFLFGMATLHLGNYPLRQWLWRAPAFAVVEAIAESAASAALILMRREPVGSTRAAWSDWPSIATSLLAWRLVWIVAFALLLALIVRIVRQRMARRDVAG